MGAVSKSKAAGGVIDAGVLTRDLHLTSPAMRGADVRALQDALTALGYSPGPSDGIYGVAHRRRRARLPADHGLEVDGNVGAMTRDALVQARPGAEGNGNGNGGGSDVGRQALAEALSTSGRESAGSNRTPFGQWFGVDGVPWCNIFVSYAFRIGADYTICKGSRAPALPKGCTYVPTTEAWLKAAGMWRGRATPLPGDIAIFNWDGGRPTTSGSSCRTSATARSTRWRATPPRATTPTAAW